MKRFEFTLERVRVWREDQAELEQAALQKLHGAREAVEQRKRSLAVERSQLDAQLYAERSFTAEDLAALSDYREHLQDQMKRAEREKAKLEDDIAQQQQRVLEARRKAELLNTLKGNALAVWRKQRDKEEEELAAELFLARKRRETRFEESS